MWEHWVPRRMPPLLAALPCLWWLLFPAPSAAQGSPDDLVALQVDLPPDVQRMFEEMCELEGISQSEMLTRWIDARWEAMGYNDSDLDGVEATEGALACEIEGRCYSSTNAAGGREAVPDTEATETLGTSRVERRATSDSGAGTSAGAGDHVSAARSKMPAALGSTASHSPAGSVAATKPEGGGGGRRREEQEKEEEEEDDDDERGVPDLDEWMRRHSAGEEDGDA